MKASRHQNFSSWEKGNITIFFSLHSEHGVNIGDSTVWVIPLHEIWVIPLHVASYESNTDFACLALRIMTDVVKCFKLFRLLIQKILLIFKVVLIFMQFFSLLVLL